MFFPQCIALGYHLVPLKIKQCPGLSICQQQLFESSWLPIWILISFRRLSLVIHCLIFVTFLWISVPAIVQLADNFLQIATTAGQRPGILADIYLKQSLGLNTLLTKFTRDRRLQVLGPAASYQLKLIAQATCKLSKKPRTRKTLLTELTNSISTSSKSKVLLTLQRGILNRKNKGKQPRASANECVMTNCQKVVRERTRDG